jgi:PAS domain S-box-containing protein
MFFGGANGFNAFYPEQIVENLQIPPVVITDFQLANKSVPIGGVSVLQKSILETDALILSYLDRVFSFEFAALNYRAADKNQYKYRMEGFEEEWNEVDSTRRFATYTNLDPGDYVFRVIASNNDGVWNEEGASITITITPPWWQTTWFRMGLGLLIVGLLAGGYRWRVSSVEARSRELELLVQERSLALNSAEEQIRTLFESAQVGIGLSTVEGRLLSVNKALQEITGFEENELLQRNVIDLYLEPEERMQMLKQLQESNTVRDFGTKILRKDGSFFFASMNVSKLGQKGEDILLAVIEDVSKIVEAEGALRVSEQRSRALFQNMPLPSYYWRRSGENYVLVDCNDAADEETNGNARKMLGMTLTAMYPDRPDIVEDISRCFIEKVTIKKEMGYTFRSTEQDQVLAVTYVYAPPDLVIVQTEDISDRKMLETQLAEAAARAERDRLSRDLHDSVTQSIYSASLIAETMPVIWEEDPEQGRRGLKQLERFNKGALAEMRNLLLEMNPTALTDQELPILMRQLADAMMARTNTTVTTTVVGDCIMPVEVKIALYSVTQEALNNVAKHAQASRANINLQDDGSQISVRIRDDGRGFDPQVLQSYGLGIGIMQDRVQDIAAELTITSQVSQGTEILVEWRADGRSLS